MDTSDDRSTLTKKKIAHYVGCQDGVERPLNQHELQLVVHHALECISHALSKGRKVELRNFGVFDVVARKARIGRNPKNPAITMQIPPKNAVRFRPGKELKTSISKLGQIQ